MAAKSVQRQAGVVWAAVAFLLAFGFHIPSPQAECWITIDGGQRQTTLETSRTIQAALEFPIGCPDSYIYPDDCVSAYFSMGNPYGRYTECSGLVCTDGNWSSSYVNCYAPGNCFSSSDSGTWDVVCECLQDSDCDDGAFCNGTESCVDTACVAGSPPCSEGQVCDEGNGQCVECMSSADCDAGYECVEGECEPIPDNPPALTAGPFVAAGNWPVLPTSQESPMYLDANYSVLWTFSDDYATCPGGECTHAAEYQKVNDSTWTELTVNTDPTGKKFAYVTLPVESLQNATTYAFRYSVTDCASQTTQSQTYYFRVAVTDAPPVITAGPFVAADTWPVMRTTPATAIVLDQNYSLLWTFSDDYASCAGLCTHRARYRNVISDTPAVTRFATVSTDPTGKKFAYAELPVESLAPGTYTFYFDVLDCNGQRTYSKTYYFKVE